MEKNDRYSRQTALAEVGEAGQQRIRQARVLIVGVGGLGSPIALYLAAAGVGCLGLLDADTVSVTNLQRQVLYTEAELGLPKAECAARRLAALNSGIEVVAHNTRLTEENAAQLIAAYDMVVDGCDNYATRYLMDRVCAEQGKPYVYGSIEGFEGQVAVFHAAPHSDGYADLFPTPPAPQAAPIAVMGVTPAVVGSVQANEVLKLIVDYGTSLQGKLWTIDLRSMQSFVVDFGGTV